ncbi:MAG TPA: hypothetical protein VHM25_28870 [Polyangiaceae bacterium]|jgi:hypothetical protein|nr:hypothetical protein [Polyangiaceae bacterium]
MSATKTEPRTFANEQERLNAYGDVLNQALKRAPKGFDYGSDRAMYALLKPSEKLELRRIAPDWFSSFQRRAGIINARAR